MAESDADRAARFAGMSPAERNALMLDRIRSMPVAPYTEGAYVLRIIEVPGRVTGKVRQTPIAVVGHNGRRYLCAPNRRRDWVRNLLAAGRCRLAENEPECRAMLVDGSEGAPVLSSYLTRLGRVSEEWPFTSDAPVEEISRYTDSTAVFRVEAVQD